MADTTFAAAPGNQPPDGTDATIAITISGHVFSAADFGFTDPDADPFTAVRIDTLPAFGSLKLNGDPISEGVIITVADIPRLSYSPNIFISQASFTFSVADGTQFDPVPNTITFNAATENTAPTITSNDGADTATITIAENASAVATMTAEDAETSSEALTWSIVGGEDASLFTISPTGELTLVAPLNYEALPPAGTEPGYQVEVEVSDGDGATDTQLITVTVANANDAPTGTDATITTPTAESYTFSAADFGFTDQDAGDQLVAVRIDSLPTAGILALNGDPILAGTIIALAQIPNLTYTASLIVGLTTFTFSVADGSAFDVSPNTITFDVVHIDTPPVITSNGGGDTAAITVLENATAVTTITASDVETLPQNLTYSISGGEDAALFAISGTGELTLANPLDFEALPAAGATPGYQVVVKVTDGSGGFDTQTITVNIANIAGSTIIGTSGADLITPSQSTILPTPTSEEDSIVGNAGADTIDSGAGNDSLFIDRFDQVDAGAGTDAVFLQDASDFSFDVGAAHAEWVYGWTGKNTLNASTATTGVTLVGEAGADQLIGSAFNDLIYMDAFDTLIDAGGGDNDALIVYRGNGQGILDTTINVASANAEWVRGGDGNDTIFNTGRNVSVSLSGGAGNDTITGGLASDYLYGNAGNDVFVVTANAQHDVVIDFANGQDRLDVRALGAAFDTFAEIQAVASITSGPSTTLDFGAGNVIVLYNFAIGNLDATDFVF